MIYQNFSSLSHFYFQNFVHGKALRKIQARDLFYPMQYGEGKNFPKNAVNFWNIRLNPFATIP